MWLSDGRYYENLVLFLLFEKWLEKIVIFDGLCNFGGDKYVDFFLNVLKLVGEKLCCFFVGENGWDVNEDIKDKFLKVNLKKRLCCYRFWVCYYDEGDNNIGKEG